MFLMSGGELFNSGSSGTNQIAIKILFEAIIHQRVETRKREMFNQNSVIRHCTKQKYFPWY